MRKTNIENYETKKIELNNSVKNNVNRSMRLLLTSINNFSLIIFGIDNGGAQ